MKLFPNLANDEEKALSSANQARFQMDESIWASLFREPFFQSHLAEQIKKCAAEQVREQANQILEEARTQGRLEGFEEGLKQASETATKSVATLDRTCESLMEQKTSLLREHESSFCQALLAVLQKVAVPEAGDIVGRVEGLLAKYRDEFPEKNRLEVSVSPETLARLASAKMEPTGKTWSLRADTHLVGDAVRLNFGGIGLEVSVSKFLQELQASSSEEFRKAG